MNSTLWWNHLQFEPANLFSNIQSSFVPTKFQLSERKFKDSSSIWLNDDLTFIPRAWERGIMNFLWFKLSKQEQVLIHNHWNESIQPDILLTLEILAAAIGYSCSAASVIRSALPHPLSFSSCFEFQLIWSAWSQRWREVKSLVLNEMLSTFTISPGMSDERNLCFLMISLFWNCHTVWRYSISCFIVFSKHFPFVWSKSDFTFDPLDKQYTAFSPANVMLMPVKVCAVLSHFCDSFPSSTKIVVSSF